MGTLGGMMGPIREDAPVIAVLNSHRTLRIIALIPWNRAGYVGHAVPDIPEKMTLAKNVDVASPGETPHKALGKA